MVIFYKKWKKNNDIQLIRNKMGLNNRMMKNYQSSLEKLLIGYYLHTPVNHSCTFAITKNTGKKHTIREDI